MKVRKIYEPVYRFDLLFFCGMSFDKVNKILKKRFDVKELPEWLKDSMGVTCTLKESDNPKSVKGIIYLVWVRDEDDFYCLLHEVSHLVGKVFEEKAMTINEHTTEAFAYYQEFWFRKLWRIMNEKVKKRK